jgi:hypothetical protein
MASETATEEPESITKNKLPMTVMSSTIDEGKFGNS